MQKTRLTLMIIGCCLCVAWAFVAQAAPQIEFAADGKFDFGNVPANEKLTHTFVFKNTGDAVLKIEQVKGG